MKASKLESALFAQMKAVGLLPTKEFHFCPGRKWRFDFAFEEQKLGIECDGGVWVTGRHNTGQGFVADMEKLNRATLLGWRVLRYDWKAIKSGRALSEIEVALAGGIRLAAEQPRLMELGLRSEGLGA